jgi:glyoxylase-like metal-dependent hydrolase (beta-lactamase superfamily II)
MLTEIADGVFVHQAECIATNGVVVRGLEGVLVVDPGLTETELAGLADDIRATGQDVVAGFSTHPDWDHALWHPALGTVPQYATAAAATWMRDFLAQDDWRDQLAGALPEEVAGQLPLESFGQLTPLPAGAAELPWNGPRARILEHRAHAVGHAALLLEDARVLVAGDMLSDVLVPMLDGDADDPVGDYLAALDMFEGIASQVDVVVPGHGSPGNDVRERIARDRAYVEALRDGRDADDLRILSPQPGGEWVSYNDAGQRERFAP